MKYNVPDDWVAVYSQASTTADFEGEVSVPCRGILIGWKTPDNGFISPDKLGDEYKILPENQEVASGWELASKRKAMLLERYDNLIRARNANKVLSDELARVCKQKFVLENRVIELEKRLSDR